ncbi:hypothetical protein RB195_022504 [Necator americanus]|uniref:Uncharacterized protein n=1 Tax=Necator americanus TaxID=51031 RepID=A0ABR1EFS2_NECAM
MSDVSNFSAWETLPEDESPPCIAVRRPEPPPRHFEAASYTFVNFERFSIETPPDDVPPLFIVVRSIQSPPREYEVENCSGGRYY